MTSADLQISTADRNAAFAPNRPAVRGLNHVTLAVRDRERSIAFYCDRLGFTLVARYPKGAYLEAGSLWLVLHVDAAIDGQPRRDYTHLALDVDQATFDRMAPELRSNATVWQENTSEGDSLYVLDPDGHKLEIHVGTLATRLAKPWPGLEIITK